MSDIVIPTESIEPASIIDENGNDTTKRGDTDVGSHDHYEKWMKAQEAKDKAKERYHEKKAEKIEEPKVSKDLTVEPTEPKVTAKESKEDDKAEVDSKSEDNALKVDAKEVKEDKVEAKPLESIKIKVNGVEKELTIEEAKVQLQKALAGENKFEEANQIRLNAERLIETLKTNPGAVLDKVGITEEQLEQYYFQKFLEPKVNPQAAEQRKMAEELAHYKAMEAESEASKAATAKEIEDREHEEAVKNHTARYQQMFSEALKSEGLPETEYTLGRMASYMSQALQNNRSDLTANDIAKLVKTDWNNSNKELLTNMDPEKIIETLGEDVIEAIRQYQVKKATQPKFNPQQATEAKRVDPKDVKAAPRKRITSIYDLLDD